MNDQGEISLQDLLRPLTHVDTMLIRFRDMQNQLLLHADLLDQFHPQASASLRTTAQALQETINYFENEKWMVILAFRATLQSHLRREHRLPTALEYGLPYGRKGDVIGALLEWKAPGVACVSFMLNGRDLGEAYELPEAGWNAGSLVQKRGFPPRFHAVARSSGLQAGGSHRTRSESPVAHPPGSPFSRFPTRASLLWSLYDYCRWLSSGPTTSPNEGTGVLLAFWATSQNYLGWMQFGKALQLLLFCISVADASWIDFSSGNGISPDCCRSSCSPTSLLTIAGVGFLAGGALTIGDPLASLLLVAM
eukprot:s203_g43.t1